MKNILLFCAILFSSYITIAQCEQITLLDEYTACPGEALILDSGAMDATIIEWFLNGEPIFGENSPFLTVTEGGSYTIEALIDGTVCSATTQVFFAVTPETSFNPIENGDIFCLNEIVAITAGTILTTCETGNSETNMIPDGNGDSYEFCLTIDCFQSDAVVTSAQDLESFCLNMEHSYVGDLVVELIAPDGTIVTLFNGGGGGGLYLGIPVDVDQDPETPGTGFDYCFSPQAETTLINGPTETINGNTTISSGTFLPVDTFDAFIGSPLNGDWCLRITDNLAIDNGFLFGFNFNFDDTLFNNQSSETPNAIVDASWEDNPNILSVNDNTITVVSDTPGDYCYDYTVIDDFGCSYTETICITIADQVIAQQPSALELCDPDNDGFATFDLSVLDDEISNGNTSGLLIVSYHETLAEAEQNVNTLPTLYNNSTPFAQTIYARLSLENANCFDVVAVQLIVNELPNIATPNDLIIEEENTDGFATFDLTVSIDEIVQGDFDLTVWFFETQVDAETFTNPIANSTAYTNTTNPQTIFVRVENQITGCIAFTSVQLIVLNIDTADTDEDGIPDNEEDVNGNDDLEDDDTDDDGIPNYQDPDDDGDAVPTAIEIEGIGAGFGPQDLIDTDDDTIENYLDSDDDGDGVLTIDEDYNNNGSPLDDDTNANDIPDFLDDAVFLSTNQISLNKILLYPNPTEANITLILPSLFNKGTYTIWDSQGKLVMEESIMEEASGTTIDLSKLTTGVYFIRIAMGSEAVLKKFVKK